MDIFGPDNFYLELQDHGLPEPDRQAAQKVAHDVEYRQGEQQRGFDQGRRLQATGRPIGQRRGAHQGAECGQQVDAEEGAQHDAEVAPIGQRVRSRKVPYTCHFSCGFP